MSYYNRVSISSSGEVVTRLLYFPLLYVLNLNLGVGTELTAGQIRLTLLDALPDDVTPGEKIQARFRIENLGGRLTGASLNTRVFTTNGVSLADAGPSIVIYTFEGPDTFDEQTVTLSVVGDNLEGTMLTNWTLAEGYDRELRVRIEFTSAAPSCHLFR